MVLIVSYEISLYQTSNVGSFWHISMKNSLCVSTEKLPISTQFEIVRKIFSTPTWRSKTLFHLNNDLDVSTPPNWLKGCCLRYDYLYLQLYLRDNHKSILARLWPFQLTNSPNQVSIISRPMCFQKKNLLIFLSLTFAQTWSLVSSIPRTITVIHKNCKNDHGFQD